MVGFLIILEVQALGGRPKESQHLVGIPSGLKGDIGLTCKQATDGKMELFVSKQLLKEFLIIRVPAVHDLGLDPRLCLIEPRLQSGRPA